MIEFIEYLKEEIKSYSFNEDYINRMLGTLSRIVDYTKDKNVRLIYPQNVFLERQDSKFYIFLERHILIASCSKYNSSIEVLKGKDIEKIEKIRDNETKNLILRIYFYSGRLITLNNNLDGDREHVDFLKEQIEKVLSCVIDY